MRNKFYEEKNMPEEFLDAVAWIMEFCQNEDCTYDCEECPYSLRDIRCGDVPEERTLSCPICGKLQIVEAPQLYDGHCHECGNCGGLCEVVHGPVMKRWYPEPPKEG